MWHDGWVSDGRVSAGNAGAGNAGGDPLAGSGLRVLFATAELAPLARVGGLAQAAAGLVGELRRQGVHVDVVVPDYFGTPLADQVEEHLAVPPWAAPAVARTGCLDGVGQLTLVEVDGIRRPHPYNDAHGQGWGDNSNRFFGFCAAVADLVRRRQPDVLHLNDWHTAVTPAYLNHPTPPTVLTIHTLGYQGQASRGWLGELPHWPERYWWDGVCSPLVGGIRSADLVVTVSPTYAREITTAEFGFGLDGLLRDCGDRLVGILNGIDAEEWDPATDRYLPANYSATELGNKAQVKAAVLSEFGLTPTGTNGAGPLLAMVTRLVHQKGVDLLLPIVPYLRTMGARLAVLGSGDADLVDWLAQVAGTYPDDLGVVARYDERLAHMLIAGGDIFVMPSRFEPCGLAQMQAMRYGTLPVVTDVGGLHDTVVDVDREPKRGTGVVTGNVSTTGLLDGVHRAVRAYSSAPRRTAMQRRGMTTDWSWTAPAGLQIDWYRRLIAERSG